MLESRNRDHTTSVGSKNNESSQDDIDRRLKASPRIEIDAQEKTHAYHSGENFQMNGLSPLSYKMSKFRQKLELKVNEGVFSKVMPLQQSNGLQRQETTTITSSENTDQLQVGQLFKMVIQQPRGQRNTKQMNQLASMLWEHPFFKSRELVDHQIVDILQVMQLETAEEKQDIFQYGDAGDLFYLILDGVVEVWVPDENTVTEFHRCIEELKYDQEVLQELQKKHATHVAKLKQMEEELEMLQKNNKKGKGVIKVDLSLKKIAIEDEQTHIEEMETKIKTSVDDLIFLQHRKRVDLMIPTSLLGCGLSFGDTSLHQTKAQEEKSSRRNATIRCQTPCTFITMTKEDYQQILDKIDQKRIDKLIEFFKNVQFLRGLTTTQVKKNMQYLERKECLRNHIVCHEGAPSEFVYIVGQGEFELTKFSPPAPILQQKTTEENKIHALLEMKKTGFKIKGPQNIKNPVPQKIPITKDLKMCLLTAGQAYGVDDILSDSPYKATMTCTRQHSFYYQIPKHQFLKICRMHSEIGRTLKSNNQIRLGQDAKMITNFYQVTAGQEAQSMQFEHEFGEQRWLTASGNNANITGSSGAVAELQRQQAEKVRRNSTGALGTQGNQSVESQGKRNSMNPEISRKDDHQRTYMMRYVSGQESPRSKGTKPIANLNMRTPNDFKIGQRKRMPSQQTPQQTNGGYVNMSLDNVPNQQPSLYNIPTQNHANLKLQYVHQEMLQVAATSQKKLEASYQVVKQQIEDEYHTSKKEHNSKVDRSATSNSFNAASAPNDQSKSTHNLLNQKHTSNPPCIQNEKEYKESEIKIPQPSAVAQTQYQKVIQQKSKQQLQKHQYIGEHSPYNDPSDYGNLISKKSMPILEQNLNQSIAPPTEQSYAFRTTEPSNIQKQLKLRQKFNPRKTVTTAMSQTNSSWGTPVRGRSQQSPRRHNQMRTSSSNSFVPNGFSSTTFKPLPSLHQTKDRFIVVAQSIKSSYN